MSICADTIIYGVGATLVREKCVEVKKGIITRITDSPTGAPLYDYRGQGTLLVPSAVDIHVHLRGLRLRAKEDAFSGTAAAAKGGVSVVIDMPNTDPPLKTLDALEWKLEELDREAIVDYGVYAGLAATAEDLSKLLRLPVVGVKLYPEDYDSLDCTVIEILRNKLLIVHPELPELIRDYSENVESRAVQRGCHAETGAVEYIAGLVSACAMSKRGPQIHITHVSCPGTVFLAKRYGFTVDTTVHYMLSWMLLGKPSPWPPCYLKVNPPLRPHAASAKIYYLTLSGEVDMIASDHAPHTPRDKSLDPLICPPGIASLEVWPSIILRIALSQNDPSLYVRLAARNPAKLLGSKRLGLVREGYYANLAVYRIDKERIFMLEYSKARYTPLVPQPTPQLEHHVVRGATVYTAEEGVNEGARGMNIVELS